MITYKISLPQPRNTFLTSIIACALISTLCIGCSKEQSNQDVALWQAMVMQAEQMRREELSQDVTNLSQLLGSDNQEAFQDERQRICTKWSRVEKLSPVPVNINYTREYIPVPDELPCNSETLVLFMRKH